MRTAMTVFFFLIATGLSTATMAASGQHTKVLRLYNHTPMILLHVQADRVYEQTQNFADPNSPPTTVEQNFSTRVDNIPNMGTQRLQARDRNMSY